MRVCNCRLAEQRERGDALEGTELRESLGSVPPHSDPIQLNSHARSLQVASIWHATGAATSSCCCTCRPALLLHLLCELQGKGVGVVKAQPCCCPYVCSWSTCMTQGMSGHI
jgi:hypothetical protein